MDHQARSLPSRTSTKTLQTSLRSNALELDRHLAQKVLPRKRDGREKSCEDEETVLYLAYGSNLSSEIFRGKRGIKPLSQVNVYVPELKLTFDLAGLPYVEPCFAATQYRATVEFEEKTKGRGDDHIENDGSINHSSSSDVDIEKPSLIYQQESRCQTRDYHKNRWHKPLVGVVYEVTLTDYAHIIATEGGGHGYSDRIVTCYPFPNSYRPSDPVPDHPGTLPFKAHTLVSPRDDNDEMENPLIRPDPAYAQPSARYLKLIRDGAAELNLPVYYRVYLADIRPFRITTTRQRVGQGIVIGIWGPLLLLLILLSMLLADENGFSPEWLTKAQDSVAKAMWSTYDQYFRKVFGEGERTIEDV